MSENNIFVCKALLLSLTLIYHLTVHFSFTNLANYQLTTMFLAKYQLTVNPFRTPQIT